MSNRNLLVVCGNDDEFLDAAMRLRDHQGYKIIHLTDPSPLLSCDPMSSTVVYYGRFLDSRMYRDPDYHHVRKFVHAGASEQWL